MGLDAVTALSEEPIYLSVIGEWTGIAGRIEVFIEGGRPGFVLIGQQSLDGEPSPRFIEVQVGRIQELISALEYARWKIAALGVR